MRLTLRTLLAYLDEILEPADSRELGQKIEQSEFASGLVHRIRSVTRKLRLGAPKLSGKGMGLDPNTVAEYLDNTLPPDRIPDFEKVCIESDVHLAEVASCHQILTLVLGEPADVDPVLRERIRGLSTAIAMPAAPPTDHPPQPPEDDQPVPPPVEAPHAESAAGASTSAAMVRPSPTMVASSHSRLLPLVGTMLIAFVLALIALFAIGPMDHTHPVLGVFFSAPVDRGQVAQRTEHLAPSDRSPAADQKTENQQSVAGHSTSRPQADSAASGKQSPTADSTALGSPGTLSTTTDQSPRQKMNSGIGPDATRGTQTAPKPLGNGTGSDHATMTSDGETGGKAAGSVTPAPVSSSEPRVESSTPATAKETATDVNEVGRCLSDQHILARFDRATRSWLRLAPLSPLRANDRLLAFPASRPLLSLTPGIQVFVIGPTEITVRRPDAEGIPGITIAHGQLLIATDGKSGIALNIEFAERRGRVSFNNADSVLAIQCNPYLPPGSNPETFKRYHVAQLYAQEGPLPWQDTVSPAPISIEAGSIATLIDQRSPQLNSSAPKPSWIDIQNTPLIDRDAAKQLEQMLAPDRPLSISLQEQTNNRLVEVRSLAVRCLGQLGYYDVFVNALNDKDLRSYWPGLFQSMQSIVASNPQSAAVMREMLERLRGDDGKTMYRLLWGYSPDQLKESAARHLVDLLASDAIDVRILAFENLKAITGRNFMYNPQRAPKLQKRAIMNWQKALNQGEIVFRTPPPAMPEHRESVSGKAAGAESPKTP